MDNNLILSKVKLSLRISCTDFDDELTDLISAAKKDLGIVGIDVDESNALHIRAITTYCKLNFGEPYDADRLKRSYDEQKAQLISASSEGGTLRNGQASQN